MATVPPATRVDDATTTQRIPRGRTEAGRAVGHGRLVAGGAMLVVASYGLLVLPRDALYPLINEDGWVESLGALGLATAAALFLVAALRTRAREGEWPRMARLSLVALAVLFTVGAGEEVSWGQRFLELDAPEAVLDANAQGELNVHNLAAINGSVDDLFTAFIWLFAIALPLAAARWSAVRERARRLVPVLPAGIALLFLVNEVAFRVVWWGMPTGWYDGRHPLSQSTHEIRETIAALLFAVAALAVARRGAGPASTRPSPR